MKSTMDIQHPNDINKFNAALGVGVGEPTTRSFVVTNLVVPNVKTVTNLPIDARLINASTAEHAFNVVRTIVCRNVRNYSAEYETASFVPFFPGEFPPIRVIQKDGRFFSIGGNDAWFT